MDILLYHGQGKIRDHNGGNINDIVVSLELYSRLRTWHSGKPLVGEPVPVILGKELPSQKYQFVVGRSSIRIAAVNYSFWGEQGYIYGQKINGQPLNFQEWSLGKILLAPGNPEGIFSHYPPVFLYLDGSPWGCYGNRTADCPEYGQLPPIFDLSTNNLDFQTTIPPAYVGGAGVDLKVALQTQYSSL